MISRKLLRALIPLVAMLGACDNNDTIAGTSSETHTIDKHSIGLIHRPDGSAAVGARVRLYSAANDTLMVRQTYVDAHGQIPLSGLARGYYSLLAQDSAGGKAVFVDSLFSDGDTVFMRPDTLRTTGTVTGKIRVQPMHTPSIAWVHLLRAGIYANADTATGTFTLKGVPTGHFNVVVRSLLKEYTPTFREVTVKSDSTSDLGNIDLVYNGLPLVTGLVAKYDSIAGVVHLSWNAAASTRRSDYFVMRSEGVNAAPETWTGMATKATNFTDTVFGGVGSTPSRYDSIERDLNWWVAVRDSNYSSGPVWFRVSLHVKSPALAQRWNVTWSPAEAGPTLARDASVIAMDSLGGSLAVLSENWVPDTGVMNKRVYHLSIRSGAGSWTNTIFDAPVGQETAPVFWKGKLWVTKGVSVRTTLRYPDFTGTPDKLLVPVWDSVRVLSTEDGLHWDSTTVATGQNSLTAFRLRASHNALRLVGQYMYPVWAASLMASESRARWMSLDGTTWRKESGRDQALDGPQRTVNTIIQGERKEIVPGPDRDWLVHEAEDPQNGWKMRTWLLPGLTTNITLSVGALPEFNQVKDGGKLLAFSTRYEQYGALECLNLADPATPASWQRISVAEAVKFTFWRGNLVTLGASGLRIGHITSN